MTDPNWKMNMFIGLFVHLRPVDSVAAGNSVRARSGRHSHGDDGDAARSGTISDGGERVHLQPDQPRELMGLQRSGDVAVLPTADRVHRRARRIQVSTNLKF